MEAIVDSDSSLGTIILRVIGCTLLAAFVYALLWKPGTNRQGLPGPPCVPILGIVPYVLPRWKIWPTEAERLSREVYKYATWGGPSSILTNYDMVILTCDPDIVKYILKDNFANYEKSQDLREFFGELLGNGIFVADGDTWYAHRKISSRLFSRRLLKYAASVVNEKCRVICNKLETALNSKDVARVDLQDWFFRLTMETTALTTFGYELDCLSDDEKEPSVVASAFEELELLCLDRLVDPFFKAKRFFYWFSNRERRIRQLKALLDDFCRQVIQNKRNKTQDLGDDLLGLFLAFREPDDVDEDIVEEELRDVIINFMVAGRDTIAAALAWTFYELTRHPSVVDKVIDEINTVCGTGEDADISFDTVGKLSYTHAVLMEALRLHPSVPIKTKYAVKDDVLPDGTQVRGGAMIVYQTLTMGRSEKLWGPNALEFQPERFLEDTEPSSFKYTVFNAGPRTCLGKPLSFIVMKLVLAHLLPKYSFVDSLGHTGEYDWFLVQKMKGGFHVDVSRR